MKLSIRVLLLVLPLLMLTVNSCKKDDSAPTGTFTTTMYTNQTGNPNADALIAHMESNDDHSLLNFYGSFNIEGKPATLSTITFQKANNDTTVFYLMNDSTGRLETSYFSVAGVKNPIVFKYDYIQGNDHALIFSVHQYDWAQSTDSLIYQTTLENNNGTLTTNPTYMAKTTSLFDISLPSAIATGIGVAEVVFAVSGSTGLITSAATAAIAAAAAAPLIATIAGLAVLTVAVDALAAEPPIPGQYEYPDNTPVLNPTTNNNPTPNLQPVINPTTINFTATMDQQGTIMFSAINGGTPPYQFSVGNPVSWQSSWTFPNNYSENTYLIAVKDANNNVSARVSYIAPSPTVTDADGNVYTVITIGTQKWLVENLRTTHFNNGDAIPGNLSTNNWASTTSAAYAHANGDSNNDATYGLLYNYYTVTDSRGVAPAGWHIPTYDDWNTLILYTGGYDNFGYGVGGSLLKSASGWDGTDAYGFKALPAGARYDDGVSDEYNQFGWMATFWSNNWDRHGIQLNNVATYISLPINPINKGNSIRCVKD